MNTEAAILGCGIVDEIGIAGTSGTNALWSELGMEPPGTGKAMRLVFNKSDPTFRRLDLLARALVLACSAADLDHALSEEQRHTTAICIETDLGALATDLQFAASMREEYVRAGIFPYSLTSTSLGEVALRHQLRGPTISLSTQEGNSGESLRESIRMLNSGECTHVVAGLVNTLIQPAAGRSASMRAIVGILTKATLTDPCLGRLQWPNGTMDPYGPFTSMCR